MECDSFSLPMLFIPACYLPWALLGNVWYFVRWVPANPYCGELNVLWLIAPTSWRCCPASNWQGNTCGKEAPGSESSRWKVSRGLTNCSLAHCARISLLAQSCLNDACWVITQRSSSSSKCLFFFPQQEKTDCENVQVIIKLLWFLPLTVTTVIFSN